MNRPRGGEHWFENNVSDERFEPIAFGMVEPIRAALGRAPEDHPYACCTFGACYAGRTEPGLHTRQQGGKRSLRNFEAERLDDHLIVLYFYYEHLLRPDVG